MIELGVSDSDDPKFLNQVERGIAGSLRGTEVPAAFVVKVDNWFGPKWMGFSNKVMGAFGVSYLKDLRIPPFVPARILSEQRFQRSESGQYTLAAWDAKLHVQQASQDNEYRKIRDVDSCAAFFWWSGNSCDTGRGVLMAYLPCEEGFLPWYVELGRHDSGWNFQYGKRISKAQFLQVQGRAT